MLSLELPTFQYADSFKSTIITGKNKDFFLYIFTMLQCYSALENLPVRSFLPILFIQQVQFSQLRTQPVKGMKLFQLSQIPFGKN